ncbi:MAG: phosphoribosylformylglycinamidine synthase subunit PurL [Bacteroidota bacterium]
MSETQVSLSTAEELGLLPEEVDRIQEILGREPNFTELSIFSVMWSEYCSYKNSILQLKTLPSTGENESNLIDLGNGFALTFNMESYDQGSDSYLGRINRSIISKGARPIATLNSLRFGDISLPETQKSLRGIVKVIEAWENSMGVPSVGGDLNFNSCYNANPLINTLSVGVSKPEHTSSSRIPEIGSLVFIVGAVTAKDSLFGVTLAKKESAENASTASNLDKLLLDFTLDALASGSILSVQEMGAAGICTATSLMATKVGAGMEVWLDKVPVEQDDMLPVQILLSDSSGRMLFVIESEKKQLFQSICDKWNLNYAQIGETTNSGKLRYNMNGELIAEIPAEALVRGGGAPVYEREQKEPAYMAEIRDFDPLEIIEPIEHDRVIRHLLEQVNIAAKKWAIRESESLEDGKDSTGDAAFIRLPEIKTAILISAECNSRYVQADPEKGAMLAVAKAARNIACAGGTPRAVSNSLNFGDPYNPEVYYQFAQSIKGIGAACQTFNTPASGGNVSLNNESESGPILPTPLIAMLGTVEDAQADRVNLNFNAKGDQIYLLGKVIEDFASSEYVYSYHQRNLSPAPYVNLEEEQELLQCLQTLIAEKAISSAHNVSEGGLIISLLESAFVKEMGFSLKCPEGIRKDAFLYGESGGRAIVSVSTPQLAKFIKITSGAKVDALHLGTVAGDHMVIDGEKMDEIQAYKRLYKRALKHKLGL